MIEINGCWMPLLFIFLHFIRFGGEHTLGEGEGFGVLLGADAFLRRGAVGVPQWIGAGEIETTLAGDAFFWWHKIFPKKKQHDCTTWREGGGVNA